MTRWGDPGYGNLIFDQAGNIYGYRSAAAAGGWVVFKLTRSGSGWTQERLWHFTGGNDGSYPASGVIFDNAGNLYGTTSDGGSGSGGTVYELSPTQSGWTETTLHAFDAFDYRHWIRRSHRDAHGNLFGIAGWSWFWEKPSAAYELTPQRQLVLRFVVATLGNSFRRTLASPTFDSQGNLYGPIACRRQRFRPDFPADAIGNQWLFSPFYQFESCKDGDACYPVGAVTFDASGNMYGTTETEELTIRGTVWEITP